MTAGEGVILVVDDDPSVNQAIERLLAAAGLRSRCFSSAEELLASGASSGAAVLILDIQLPGMSGLDLFRELSSAGRLLPVIFITGQDRPNIRELAQESGAAAYFTKPFEGMELLTEIHRHLPAARSPET